MNDLSRYMYRKKMTLREACDYLDLPYTDEIINSIEVETCSSCSIWHLPKELHPDLDGLPTCRICLIHYGE